MSYQDRQYSPQVGFTLVELIITIAIMAIIAAMATPGMQQQIQQAKIKETANAIESLLRESQAQAITSQRSTKLVLTNMISDKNFKLFYVSDVNATAKPQSVYTIDKAITITPIPNNLTAVSFTPNKKSYQGETTDSIRMGQNTAGDKVLTGFYICLGTGTNRYLVSIDANNMIRTQESGSC